MKRHLITNIIYVAIFLFVLNQSFVQNLWSSIQIGKIVKLSEQTISLNNNESYGNDSEKSGIFGLDIKIAEPTIFRIQLGQLQLTLNTEM